MNWVKPREPIKKLRKEEVYETESFQFDLICLDSMNYLELKILLEYNSKNKIKKNPRILKIISKKNRTKNKKIKKKYSEKEKEQTVIFVT